MQIDTSVGTSALDQAQLVAFADKAQKILNARQAKKILARRHFLDFVLATPPALPYYIGKHTRAIGKQLEQAELNFCLGISSYLVFICPPRHGKSDLGSRRFGPWFLGRHPDKEIMLATYGANLAHSMSRKARACVRSEEYQGVFPGVNLAYDSRSVGDWSIENHDGSFHAVGLEGAITGHGADVLIIDDYIKGRENAESETIREKVFGTFADDLMTRLAPTHIVAILATRWHEDDLVGRLQEKMENDSNFPAFQVFRFPALDEARHTTGTRKRDCWLFPQRFSQAYYEARRALAGSYSWQAMFQGDPRPRQGNLLRADRIQFYTEPPSNLSWVRGWDLASSEKQRIKEEPDFTVGVKLAVTRDKMGIEKVYIDDVIRGQWLAPKRDQRMYETALRDGANVRVAIEQVAGYKDAVANARKALKGKAVVIAFVPTVDKVIRAQDLEPILEAGNFFCRQAIWNDDYVKEFLAFPRGKKDDQVDGTTTAYKIAQRSGRIVTVT